MNSLRVAVFGSTQKVPIYALKRCFHLSSALLDAMKQPSYYEVLQIKPDSTHTEIRDAYYKLSKMFHPDVKKDENSLAMFRKITEAYDTLGNVRTRLEYDNQVLGKYQPYDTSKSDFYASLYRDQCFDGVRRPDVSKVMENKSVVDKFLDGEYKDRVAEFRTYKRKTYEHYLVEKAMGGPFGLNRILFCACFALFTASIKFLEDFYEPFSGWPN